MRDLQKRDLQGGVIWRNGLPDLNPSSALLLNFCANQSLSITNIMFEHKDVHVAPGHPRPRPNDQFCYCIIRSICPYVLDEPR